MGLGANVSSVTDYARLADLCFPDSGPDSAVVACLPKAATHCMLHLRCFSARHGCIEWL